MLETIRQRLANLIAPARNSMSLPSQFLKYGNTNRMTANWSEIMMSDRDLYTGYVYSAIRNRAVATARIAVENVKTENDQNVADLNHPYCELIWDSKTFTEFAFWSQISTYLDLEGVYYLMAIRASSSSRKGTIKELKLLNPYNVSRVIDEKTMEVTGYIETRNGMIREIPPEMIIEIRELNPFNWNENYSMTDAAKESQFTLKASGDYTRHAIRNNINAPGIISTDVILDPQVFDNFKARIRNATKGEPLFGNGEGAITYESMQQDLSKAALKDTNEIGRDAVVSVTGMSKTMLGIEQSGTTRETARVQKDLFAEGQIVPRIQLIIDALNLDYRNNYPEEFEQNPIYLYVENPQEVDQATEKTKSEVSKANFELYQSLVAAGYTPKKAASYVAGDIDVEGLGKPKNPPVVTTTEPTTPPADDTQPQSIKKKVNHVGLDVSEDIVRQKGVLKNAIINVERTLVTNAINRVDKNAYDEESDVVTKREKNSAREELAVALAAFYLIIFKDKGPEVMSLRGQQLAMSAIFKLNNEMKAYIKEISQKVAEHHINTVSNLLWQLAREAALAGKSQQEIVSLIGQNFTEKISTNRAETVARSETNRAFTQTQYYADQQFISQNDLDGRAFKRWVTRSDDPCAYCEALEKEGLIPFHQNFRNLDEEVVVGKGKNKKVLQISFESLQAGNAHPNCSCIYELVIK